MGIWYPTDGTPSPQPLAMFSQTVVTNGEVCGDRLPVVLISHGTGGWLGGHYDTAIALAEAGFVVIALTHTGDNYADQRYTGNQINLVDRPRQVHVVLDWLFSSWSHYASLDPNRVGMFGFSLGGFTTLVESGGTPEPTRMTQLCRIHPEAPECAFVKQTHGDGLDLIRTQPVWVHDARIKAVVVAAPAVAYLFGPGDLRQVRVPVQLWRAQDDHQAPDAWNSAVVRDGLPHLVSEHVVPMADHFVFLAPCSARLAVAVPVICRDPAGVDRAAFHRMFNRAVVGFFKKELDGTAN